MFSKQQRSLHRHPLPFLTEVKDVLEISPKFLEKISKKQASTILGAITGEGGGGGGGGEEVEEDLRGVEGRLFVFEEDESFFFFFFFFFCVFLVFFGFFFFFFLNYL